MIRLLLLCILGFLVYSLGVALLRPFSGRPRVPRAKSSEGEEMVKDPVCGTYLPRSDALSCTQDGETHYFCSRECRDRFQSKK